MANQPKKSGKKPDSPSSTESADATEALADALSGDGQPDNSPIDQVRNILFGAEISALRDDGQRQEAELRRALDQLRDDHQRKINELTDLLKQQVSMLQDGQKAEAEARREEDKRLENHLQRSSEDLQTNLDKAVADLQQSLASEADNLNRLIETRNTEQQDALQAAKAALTDAKADRVLIASVLKTAAEALERGN